MPNKRYGVFRWNDINRYPPADAVKVFRREHDARRLADKLNDSAIIDDSFRGYVVRSFYLNDSSALKVPLTR